MTRCNPELTIAKRDQQQLSRFLCVHDVEKDLVEGAGAGAGAGLLRGPGATAASE